jgi:hypothetical protein
MHENTPSIKVAKVCKIFAIPLRSKDDWETHFIHSKSKPFLLVYSNKQLRDYVTYSKLTILSSLGVKEQISQK